MEYKQYTLLPGDLDMPAGRAGDGKNNYVILPGLSLTPVSPFTGTLAERYGADFLEGRSLWLADRRNEIPQGYTVRQTAEDTVRALESVGVTEFDLFGASMGAMTALYIAALYPERVKCLAVSSTEGRIREDEWPVFAAWRRFAAEKDPVRLTEDFCEHVYGGETLAKIRAAGPRQTVPCSDRELENFIRSIDSLHSLDAFSLCGRIRCPVLVIGSEGDRVFGTDGARKIAALTGGRLILYGPEYGHAVYDEAPDFTARVAGFLNGERRC